MLNACIARYFGRFNLTVDAHNSVEMNAAPPTAATLRPSVILTLEPIRRWIGNDGFVERHFAPLLPAHHFAQRTAFQSPFNRDWQRLRFSNRTLVRRQLHQRQSLRAPRITADRFIIVPRPCKRHAETIETNRGTLTANVPQIFAISAMIFHSYPVGNLLLHTHKKNTCTRTHKAGTVFLCLHQDVLNTSDKVAPAASNASTRRLLILFVRLVIFLRIQPAISDAILLNRQSAVVNDRIIFGGAQTSPIGSHKRNRNTATNKHLCRKTEQHRHLACRNSTKATPSIYQ